MVFSIQILKPLIDGNLRRQEEGVMLIGKSGFLQPVLRFGIALENMTWR
jgi:hypothetical protein